MSGGKVRRIEDILQSNVWDVDYEPHIKITKPEACVKCWKPCTILCPAQCYTTIGDKVIVSYEGCLECGTCRVICPYNAIEWKYPVSGRGIYYRYG